MIVNKSMFPLRTGFSVISKMQDNFATLQMQLGTGMKAQTLADMGRDLPVSLSVRSRLNTIAGYTASIDQVALRLGFYDNFLTRMDKIEGEARNSAVQGQYGTGNINMATIQPQSKARFDEMVTMLNTDISGRYLFGGSVTDKAPLATTQELLNGSGGRAGFNTVVTERKAADAGLLGQGRLNTVIDPAGSNTVRLYEDGVHPFGFKLGAPSTSAPASVEISGPNAGASPDGDEMTIAFNDAPPLTAGQSITISLTLPDGTDTYVTLTASAAASNSNEFTLGANGAATAESFRTALNNKLKEVADTELAAASTFAASQNFFNAAGEPVLRVEGDPATASSLRVATASDTVMWYRGEAAAVSAAGLGRLENGISHSTGPAVSTVTLAEKAPASAAHGFRITAAETVTSASTTSPATALTAATPTTSASATVTFDGTEAPGDNVRVTLTDPGGKVREVELVAVSGRAGPGQFSIGASVADTADNFNKALLRSVTEAAADAEGNPRQSVSASVEDSGRVNYGMQANESGYLRMIRTFASMTIEAYPEISSDFGANSGSVANAKARFDAMARRQQEQMSEGHNTERGSIEIITMEMGVARASLNAASQRHTNYKAQLDNLLSDVETVSKENVAMEIMALQTRLTASYQVTAMVSDLSLGNFLR
jgi:flagellar hook-associated protein 3 FlgL